VQSPFEERKRKEREWIPRHEKKYGYIFVARKFGQTWKRGRGGGDLLPLLPSVFLSPRSQFMAPRGKRFNLSFFLSLA